ncbi:MAG: PspC protein [Blastococcus sp.]|jgi:phage shock protein PspC (stress-responsive transcriptional regulator)|nr:PspC protein [Blastococcus sp.]
MWQPPPPPPGPPLRPQLRRSRTDKILGGVNGGLAEYSGIDALLWRVGFVALTLAAGTGVIVYLLLWLLMPAGPAAAPGAPDQRPPAGPRSPVPGVTIAGLLIVVGFLTLVSSLTDWHVTARGFLGAALLVVGAGLVTAAFTGGRTARGGLIALGVVLSIGLIAVSAIPWNGIGGGVGDKTYRPSAVAEVRDVYRNGAGDMTVDLSRVDEGTGTVSTRIEHGLGDLSVIVPRSADVQLVVEQGIGELRVFDRGAAADGFFPGTGSESWSDDGEAEFVLTINSGLGDVEVSRG